MWTKHIKPKWDAFRGHLGPFGWKIIYDWSFSLSALIAYNLIISMLPLIMSMFTILILLVGKDAKVQEEIRERLVKAFPGNGTAELIDSLGTALANQAGVLFVFSFSVSVFAGSRLFIALDDVLTIIYRLRERSIVSQNILAIRMLLTFIVILPLMIVMTTLPAVFKKHEKYYKFLTTFIGGALGFLFILAIYYIIPNRKMYFRNIWCGALFATVGIQLLALLFPIYVHQFMSNYVGQLGFVIIVLLLFYFFGVLVVIGAQINSYFFDDIQPLGAGLGTTLSEYAADRERIQLLDQTNRPTSITTLLDGVVGAEHRRDA